MTTRYLLVLACAGFSIACPAQQRDWLPVTTVGDLAPSAREGHAMIYDTLRARLVLFGGFDSTSLNSPHPRTLFGDTWERGDSGWLLAQAPDPGTTPLPRSYHAMAYDGARQRVVLFGGYGYPLQPTRPDYFGDTWEWDGKQWVRHQPSVAPAARGWFAMAYDAARKRTVLFGGYDPGGSGRHRADTWEWDGALWTRRDPVHAPTGRWGHAMSYDPVRKRTVLFGGNDGSGYLDDCWEWDGTDWVLVSVPWAPSARGWHAMAYDPHSGQTVVFGGFDGIHCFKTTYGLVQQGGASQWTFANLRTRPAGRGGHAVAYDAERRCLMTFGGYGDGGLLADTWALGDNGMFEKYGTGCGTPPVELATAPGSRPVIGTTLRLVTSNLPVSAGVALMSVGLSDQYMGGTSLPLSLEPLGMAGCHLYNSFHAVFPFPADLGVGEFRVDVPHDFALVGFRLYFQAACGLVASNGGRVTFGSQ